MHPDMKWTILYCEASKELREDSKKHWIKCYQDALNSDNESLIQASEHKLALMVLLDNTILQEV